MEFDECANTAGFYLAGHIYWVTGFRLEHSV